MEDKFELVKIVLAWAAQQGHGYAEKAAKELGDVIGEDMVEDQVHYNSYKWVKRAI